ncbi:MAG: pyridoxal phosphate-dependent aminotransferase family protein [Crocinitomicaceae bacterium]|nr:pyridoxal phosphate-dependent aminotransferase family protein [Crocinitomicaceae bacterium]MDG1777525.1 pyridoxal phosphate-dependent aminotransferase family protein [Crocinitomicaceae bacterium]
MDYKLTAKLTNRIKEGTLRSLSLFDGFKDFFSNDYLGFSKDASDVFFEGRGATGSRLISGNSKEAVDAEKKLASFFSSEAALMFNSGYDANVGFFSSIPQRGDTIIYDELIHASSRDGIRMCFANAYAFKHNSITDLRMRLEKVQGAVYVAIEGLYSMDGDIPPLKDIIDLCEEYDAYLIVDEAHSVGVYGESGKGLVSALGFENRVFARLVTFGKAYGSHGAVVLGCQQLIDYLVNFSRSFIYTTALPPCVFSLNATRATCSSVVERQGDLQSVLAQFRSLFVHEGLLSEVNSPIQVLQIGSVEGVRLVAEKLQGKSIAVKPIYSPTVAEGKERIRFCFHAFNTKSEVDFLIGVLTEVC